MMKYEIWIEGQKDKTLQIIEVPPYKDGSSPTMLKVKGVACRSSHFTWANWKNLKYERIPTKDNP